MDESGQTGAGGPGGGMSGLARWKARLTGPTARKGVWAVVDQALVSGTNFATAFMLARFCTKEEFGAYVLAFSVMLFLNGFQAALITGPMMVLGAAREGDDFRRYVTALGAAQLAAGTALTGLAFAAVGVMSLTSASTGLQGAFLGMATALFFLQTQEFVRRVLFTRLEPARVLANDVVYCTIRLGGVAALAWMDLRLPEAGRGWLSGRNVFLSTAGAGLVATAFGFWQVREYLRCSLEGAREFLLENWRFGRWLLGSTVGNLVLARANNFIVAGFVGVAGAAMLEAPRLLLAPLQILGLGGGNIIGPRAAEKHGKGGERKLMGFLKPIAVVWGLVFAGYALMIAAAPGFWLRTFFAGKYVGAETIVILWALCYAARGLRILPAVALAAIRRPDLVMLAVLGAGALMIAVSPWLTSGFGAAGAMAARLGGDVAVLGALTLFYCRSRRGKAGHPRPQPPIPRKGQST